ncbi:MAG: phosphoribosylaminoimidazolesuccinocarboxamide synthase [Verrucomicrobia bacterium]|nr:phosphoribosylaminoimidazolesuccinocarboxamide synthase [Verrucomicrobiota bacterium]
MIGTDVLKQQLGNVLAETNFEGLGAVQRGKVRDSYRQGDRRILVASDRISAFDCVLGTIPFKGQVLTQLAAFWFQKTRELVPNHLISVPDPNVMIVRECEQLPLEFVVRGYITGVTKTSAWYNYARGTRNLCGNLLPDGLRKDQKLARPIITPTTKHEAHDRNISRDEAIQEGLIDGETFDEAARMCLTLYEAAVAHAASRGLIFVDTKYELGRLDGKLVFSDEINTPDSSRYWFADTYAERFAAGEEQRKLDKEYVRQWLADRGFRGEGTPPKLTDALRIEAARRYIEAYEIVTGEQFQADLRPVRARVAAALGAS